MDFDGLGDIAGAEAQSSDDGFEARWRKTRYVMVLYDGYLRYSRYSRCVLLYTTSHDMAVNGSLAFEAGHGA